MKITANTIKVMEHASRGGLQSDLPWSINRSIHTLIRNGYITREKFHDGSVGRPTFRLRVAKELPFHSKSSQVPRKTSGLRESIISFIASSERTLGEVASFLGRPTCDVSALMLKMCVAGLLARRRVMGEIEGHAVKREWYLYRVVS